MKLPFKLDRPIAFIDVESTGLRPSRDRIVELAVLRLVPNGDGAEKDFERVRRFNPGIAIPPEAAKIHGITDDMVAAEAPFRARAKALAAALEPCDLGGFNIRSFDLPILIAEFERAGVPFDVRDRRLIDVKLIFHREEPRNLTAAMRFYLEREHEEAHTALGDTRATVEILAAQMGRYPNLPRNLDTLHAYCDEVGPFLTDFDRWFSKSSAGLVFQRGKHAGTALDEVAATSPDYLEWMLRAEDMPKNVLDAAREALGRTDLPGTSTSRAAAPDGKRSLPAE